MSVPNSQSIFPHIVLKNICFATFSLSLFFFEIVYIVSGCLASLLLGRLFSSCSEQGYSLTVVLGFLPGVVSLVQQGI